MRILASVFVTGTIAFVGCAGDSSALMSVWNDGGVVTSSFVGGAPGTGGQGGQAPYHTGGAGGGVTIPLGGSGGGSIHVAGGARDLTTAQCTSTSDGTCPVSTDYLACLEGNCGSNLTACYYSDGFSRAAGGVCVSYANCMLACPCDAGRTNCENKCLQSYVTVDPDCSTCLFNLLACTSKYNCPPTTTCASVSGGSNSGGAAGS